MTLDALIMLAGAIVGVWTFLGFPPNWDKPVLFILGVFIVALGIVVRRRGVKTRVNSMSNPPAAEPLDDGEVA